MHTHEYIIIYMNKYTILVFSDELYLFSFTLEKFRRQNEKKRMRVNHKEIQKDINMHVCIKRKPKRALNNKSDI